MLLRLQHLAYRVAAPLHHGWWTLSRARHDGVKCLVTHGGEVVLVRHTYGDRRQWDFPGGFVRRGEEPVVAARREMEEELGLRGARLTPVGTIAHRVARRRGTVHYFRVEAADARLAADPVELAEVAWFRPGELPRPLGDYVAEALAWIAPAVASAGRVEDPLR